MIAQFFFTFFSLMHIWMYDLTCVYIIWSPLILHFHCACYIYISDLTYLSISLSFLYLSLTPYHRPREGRFGVHNPPQQGSCQNLWRWIEYFHLCLHLWLTGRTEWFCFIIQHLYARCDHYLSFFIPIHLFWSINLVECVFSLYFHFWDIQMWFYFIVQLPYARVGWYISSFILFLNSHISIRCHRCGRVARVVTPPYTLLLPCQTQRSQISTGQGQPGLPA